MYAGANGSAHYAVLECPSPSQVCTVLPFTRAMVASRRSYVLESASTLSARASVGVQQNIMLTCQGSHLIRQRGANRNQQGKRKQTRQLRP
jgi:hypothetical protein